MPFTLNRVELIGRLGAEAEISKTRNGNHMAKLRLAMTETWRDKDGEQRERTEWVNVVVFGDFARALERVRKGGRIYIAGRLETREVTDDRGDRRFFTGVTVTRMDDIVFIDFEGNGRDERRGRDDSRSDRDERRTDPKPRRADRGPPGGGPPARDPGPPLDDIPY
jgi:single-strand DNA-binding protein